MSKINLKPLMLSITSAALFTVSSGLAGGTFCPMGMCGTSCCAGMSGNNFSGFYVGGDVGFRNINHGDYFAVGSTNNLRDNFSSYRYSTHTQSAEDLHVGYGKTFCNAVYLGFDFLARTAQSNFDHHFSGSANRSVSASGLDFGSTYGFNAVFGYPLKSNFMPYLSAGYELLNIKGRLSSDSGTDLAMDKYVGGPDVGVGLRYAINNRWSVNAEYNAAWFGRAMNTMTNNANEQVVLNIKPKFVTTGTVGLSYLFA